MMIDVCREVSIFEFIALGLRDFNISYKSQTVVFVNIENQLNDIKTYVKCDTAGAVVDGHDESLWEEENTIIKKYKERPQTLDFITLLQFAMNYRELEKSNSNFTKKIEELRKNENILTATTNLVEVITNEERFPLAPTYLPEYVLINDRTVIMKKRSLTLSTLIIAIQRKLLLYLVSHGEKMMISFMRWTMRS